MQDLALDHIGYDPKFYPRVNGKEDWLTVHRYKEALLSHPWKADANKPGAFPAVVVAKATGYDWPYILLDGLHRVRAFASAGKESIFAVVERLPPSKWLERSVELNIVSKRPLDSGDKRWVAKRLEEEGWKPDRIAGLLEMERASFEKLMSTGIQKLTSKAAEMIRMGRSNREIDGGRFGFLKHPFVDATGTANATATLQAQESVTSREAVQIVRSFVALLESGCIDFTNEELVEGMERAQSLLKKTLTEAVV